MLLLKVHILGFPYCLTHAVLALTPSISFFSNYKKLKEVSLRGMAVNGPDKDNDFNTVAPCILPIK